MSVHIHRLLDTDLGKFLFSALLGLGLSTIFKQSCSGQSCIIYRGPILGQIDGKTYQYGDRCYTYEISPIKCNPLRASVDLSNAIEDYEANAALPQESASPGWFEKLFKREST